MGLDRLEAHRSLQAQDIALEPLDGIGAAASSMDGREFEDERIEKHRDIVAANAERITAEPSIWEGGVRMLKAGSPEAWRAISDAAEMQHQNKNMIENAKIGAKKSQKAVRCTARTEPRWNPMIRIDPNGVSSVPEGKLGHGLLRSDQTLVPTEFGIKTAPCAAPAPVGRCHEGLLIPWGRSRSAISGRCATVAPVTGFARLPFERQKLLVTATLMLALVALLRRFFPFRAIAARTRHPDAPHAAPARQEELIAAVRWAIWAAARRVPWRAQCFEQGFAAQWLLTRRHVPTTLHYGVANRADEGMVAHVWVRAGDVDVVGCNGIDEFTELARFPLAPADRSTA